MSMDAASSPASPSSPRNRVKFMCSHGGKIVPLPGSVDPQLKYVGGETRVISVPRDITFQDLMKKLTYPINGSVVLKYQAVSEDLDALVSVKSKEDLRHMVDEIDLYEVTGSPTKLRAFLFSANTRQPPAKHLPPASSPSSPSSLSGGERETFDFMLQNSAINMLKAQSSPSICSSHNHPQYCHGYRNGGSEVFVSERSRNHCCGPRQNQGVVVGCCGGGVRTVDCGHSVNRGTVVDRRWGPVGPSPRYGQAA